MLWVWIYAPLAVAALVAGRQEGRRGNDGNEGTLGAMGAKWDAAAGLRAVDAFVERLWTVLKSARVTRPEMSTIASLPAAPE